MILALAAPVLIAVAAVMVQQPKKERTRAEVQDQVAAAERAARAQPDDPTLVLAHARLLYESGEFWRAHQLALPLAQAPMASPDAIELGARLAYLLGKYSESEQLYDRLIAQRTGTAQVMAKVGKLFTHYQRDQFDRIASMEFPAGVSLPNIAIAKQFTERPYRLEWEGGEKVSEVPFHALDPLPQFDIEVNGRRIGALFDTGGDLLILDDELAKELGVTSVASATGRFGGGLPAKMGFGKVERLRIGTVTLHGVPVMILPTRRFTFDQRYPLSAIVGTALMRQFLGTIDYSNRKLVLRERSPATAAAVRAELAGRLEAEVPFVLDATHLMYARGSLDGREGLSFFVDSGLAMDAVMVAPIQTLSHAAIPVPKTSIDCAGVGGGGGKYPTGTFPIKRISLGPLAQTNVKGQYGSLPPDSYWARGFIADGLISHGFLKQYRSWTIDFDSMTYLFGKR